MAANDDIVTLAELREKLATAKDTYWAEQVDIHQNSCPGKWVYGSIRLCLTEKWADCRRFEASMVLA